MNIYIYNCSNTFNYGSMMMGENFINYFNEVSNFSNKYFVETLDDINVERLKNATNYNEIFPVKQDSLFGEYNRAKYYVLSYLRIKNIIDTKVSEIDMLVVLGGDDFTEDYGWYSPIINAIKFNLLKRKGIKVVMLGQTMGPYRSFRKYLMKRFLKKIDMIYPRDPITFNYLEKLGINNIKLIDDLALLPLTKQEIKERTNEYITYCPSELIYRYSKTGDRLDWIRFNLFMIDIIFEKYPNKKLVLLAHVLKPDHVDDRKITNELYNKIIEKYDGKVIVENAEIYPYQVRNYIQQSLFTISSRMHPVISSIQCEIPSIALSYSDKYLGIIGKRYDLEDYIIDVRYLNYDEMKEKFITLIDKIESKYEQIQYKMKEKNKIASKSITRTLQDLTNNN